MRRRVVLAIACCGLAAIVFGARRALVVAGGPGPATTVGTLAAPEPDKSLEGIARERTGAWPPADVRVRVEKRRHTVGVHSGETLLKTYPCAFSSKDGVAMFDQGPKRREGDRRTPEGMYFVCTRNDRSPYHLFLGISYPNAADAERALANGVISQSDYDSILAAAEPGAVPPWDTKLGGEIGLHGGGCGAEWTWGCVAVSNGAIEELWSVAERGTPVEITP